MLIIKEILPLLAYYENDSFIEKVMNNQPFKPMEIKKKQFDNKKLKISLKMQTDGDLESIVETAIALMREKVRDTY